MALFIARQAASSPPPLLLDTNWVPNSVCVSERTCLTERTFLSRFLSLFYVFSRCCAIYQAHPARTIGGNCSVFIAV